MRIRKSWALSIRVLEASLEGAGRSQRLSLVRWQFAYEIALSPLPMSPTRLLHVIAPVSIADRFGRDVCTQLLCTSLTSSSEFELTGRAMCVPISGNRWTIGGVPVCHRCCPSGSIIASSARYRQLGPSVSSVWGAWHARGALYRYPELGDISYLGFNFQNRSIDSSSLARGLHR